MKFWKWLLKVPCIEDDWKSDRELLDELNDLRRRIHELEHEVGHWKTMALNFRKHHQ